MSLLSRQLCDVPTDWPTLLSIQKTRTSHHDSVMPYPSPIHTAVILPWLHHYYYLSTGTLISVALGRVRKNQVNFNPLSFTECCTPHLQDSYFSVWYWKSLLQSRQTNWKLLGSQYWLSDAHQVEYMIMVGCAPALTWPHHSGGTHSWEWASDCEAWMNLWHKMLMCCSGISINLWLQTFKQICCLVCQVCTRCWHSTF